MTEAELKAFWIRWMHRRDIELDAETVLDLARDRVEGSLMSSTMTVSDILANYPRMLQHAGLIYLHELAQDAEGEQREIRHYNDALADFEFRQSRVDNPDPSMARNPSWGDIEEVPNGS